MTRRPHRLCAGLLIVSLLASGCLAAGLSVHVFLQHADPADIAISLDALLHGHDHSEGTPDHEHALFSPYPPKLNPEASFAVFPPAQTSEETPARPQFYARAFAGSSGASGAGPPFRVSPLRV